MDRPDVTLADLVGLWTALAQTYALSLMGVPHAVLRDLAEALPPHGPPSR